MVIYNLKLASSNLISTYVEPHLTQPPMSQQNSTSIIISRTLFKLQSQILFQPKISQFDTPDHRQVPKYSKRLVKQYSQFKQNKPLIQTQSWFDVIIISSERQSMQRLQRIEQALLAENISTKAKETLNLVDNRTGKSVTIPLHESKDCYFVNSKDVGKLVDEKGQPLRLYDPGYLDTICNTSRISYIDGDQGILEYRGIPIEQLAEKSTFLQVAFLLIYGELPSKKQLGSFQQNVMSHTMLHTDVSNQMGVFRYDAHPMGMIISTISAFSTLKPDANPALAGEQIYKNQTFRNKQIYRLLGVVPTIAANAFRHRIGRQYNLPTQNLGYVENFLYMLDRLNQHTFKPHPKLARALDILFILHAEHEMNCSTSFMRHITSSGVDVYTAIAMSAGALYGPKHGGANEAVIRMLEEIKTKENIPKFINEVKNKNRVLFGFGHRVYKNYDPRAKIIKKVAFQVFEICGKEPLIQIAIELQKIALEDEYFISRKLYPNVDFYSGLIYRAMGFPTDMYPVLFTIPRVAGWIAHWVQFVKDSQNNIYRPRQNYVGHPKRQFVEVANRKENQFFVNAVSSKTAKRREAAQKYKEEAK